MSELKPCPFCGSKPEQYDNEYACCTGSKCPMANMVIDNRVWNTRAVLAQEAGKAEPVAWGTNSDLEKIKDGARWSGTLWGVKNPPMLEDRTPLYTSPPAPVSVGLPERMTREQALELTDYPPESAMYWYNKALDDVRACLDKVKEMNQ